MIGNEYIENKQIHKPRYTRETSEFGCEYIFIIYVLQRSTITMHKILSNCSNTVVKFIYIHMYLGMYPVEFKVTELILQNFCKVWTYLKN